MDSAQGDGAKEAAYQAERQFMEEDFDKKEFESTMQEEFGSGNDFQAMAYKDDDGNWRITDNPRVFDSYEDLVVFFRLRAISFLFFINLDLY